MYVRGPIKRIRDNKYGKIGRKQCGFRSVKRKCRSDFCSEISR